MCFAYEDVLYAIALAVGLDASLERPGDLVKGECSGFLRPVGSEMDGLTQPERRDILAHNKVCRG